MNIPSPVFSTTDDGDTMGGRIFRAREAMNLTTERVATQLGVKKETISAWERDRSEPRTNRLCMLAGVLGVSPVWLLSGGGTGGPEAMKKQQPDKEQLSDMIANIRRIQAQAEQAIEALETKIGSRARG